MSFLIDFWKLGIKNYFKTPYRIKYVANTYSQEFEEITKEQALKYLVRGYRIAKEVGTPITPECKKWLEAFGVTKYNVKGSLYKCYLCGSSFLFFFYLFSSTIEIKFTKAIDLKRNFSMLTNRKIIKLLY